MFIAVAIMCMDLNLSSCTQMIWPKTFITDEACTTLINGMIGQMGPQGVIVYASCFKVDDLGEPV